MKPRKSRGVSPRQPATAVQDGFARRHKHVLIAIGLFALTLLAYARKLLQ